MSEAAFLEPTEPPECDGSAYCRAPVHIHGCFDDTDAARCDEPEEHSGRAAARKAKDE